MLFIVMGVSGSGKSTLAKLLAGKFKDSVYVEGDEFHPVQNIQKMASGIPLNDQDRHQWLLDIKAKVESINGNCFVACSCLKRKYREMFPNAYFIFLAVSRDELETRLEVRKGHFMKSNMIDSQLRDLEIPSPDEEKLITFGTQDELVEKIQALIS